MKYAPSTLIIIIAANVGVLGQAAPAQDVEREKQRAREQAYNESVDRLRNVGKTTMPIDPNARLGIYTTKIRPLYRKPSLLEMKMLEPDSSLRMAFEEELSNNNSGVVKMVADEGCEAKFFVTVATPHCEKYSMPGAGSAYSFRKASHWLRHLSDLNFDGKKLIAAPGDFINGILVNVGDVPLDRITGTPEYATVAGFEPVSDSKKAAAFSALLKKGIRDGRILYASALPVMNNTTFLMRSIAYRSEFYRTVEGVEYDEMGFDTRKDVIVAFRVIGYEPDQSVTIAWKEIFRRDSPRIKR